jgi:hypothetical protein
MVEAPGQNSARVLAPHMPVTTGQPPDRVFGRHRIGALLALYQYAAKASAEATTTVSVSATATRVPHRTVLSAIHAGHHSEPVVPEAAEQLAAAQSLYEPGRIERTLRGLGVTDIDLLRRGGEIDRVVEQLIMEGAAGRESRSPDPSTPGVRSVTEADGSGRPIDRRAALAAGTSMQVQARGAEAES